jgi:hypothetical protein
MHPIERLRYVARVGGGDPLLLAQEAASALAEVAAEGVAGLVPACRRLVERHPSNGMLWWLSARVLGADDPYHAARESAAALAGDRTARVVADSLPDDATVLVVGWPDLAADALRRRGDLEALVVDSGGEGGALVAHLGERESTSIVPDRGVAAAAAVAGVVLLEALAAGPSGILAAPGSHAAAAVARNSSVTVWAVAGVGRVLPGSLWDAALSRTDAGGLEPWERPAELVPIGLLGPVVRPGGAVPAVEGLCEPDCAPAPELLRPAL